MTVPVRKPHRQEYVRVRPGESWQLSARTLVTADDRKTFLVAPELWETYASELKPTLLVMGMTRQNVVFVWPLTLPNSDQKSAWHESALEAASLAERSWIKVASNMALGAYEVFAAQGTLGEPQWPEVSFEQILDVAFKGAYIGGEDHPVLMRLRGEV